MSPHLSTTAPDKTAAFSSLCGIICPQIHHHHRRPRLHQHHQRRERRLTAPTAAPTAPTPSGAAPPTALDIKTAIIKIRRNGEGLRVDRENLRIFRQKKVFSWPAQKCTFGLSRESEKRREDRGRH